MTPQERADDIMGGIFGPHHVWPNGLCNQISGAIAEAVEAARAEQADYVAKLERAIEDMAEERHLVHGRLGDKFWSCSRPCCKAAAEFLRAAAIRSPEPTTTNPKGV